MINYGMREGCQKRSISFCVMFEIMLMQTGTLLQQYKNYSIKIQYLKNATCIFLHKNTEHSHYWSRAEPDFGCNRFAWDEM